MSRFGRTTLKCTGLVAGLLTIGTSLLLPNISMALAGSDFHAGHIIDDAIFTNANAMTVQAIQSFLDAKVGSCDNNGTGLTSSGMTRAAYDASIGKNTKFTCLNGYYENITTHANNLDGNPIPNGAISAAQIIYNAAQQYQINPQVLLTTIQKEQGLVTDTWPWDSEYTIALGYGCPDSADVCNSQYYGFYNQVDNAAWQFHQYMINPTHYNYVVGDNYILYSPAGGCTGGTVAIQNQATAALYDYTPYQPNAGTLSNITNASAGGADGGTCGSYGNRNFWWFFNEWFGSSLTNNYAMSYYAMSAYPTIPAGQSGAVWIEYKNTGEGIFYDNSLASLVGQNPLHLADSSPINRPSNFADTSWANNNRPAQQFTIYESDGTTVADDQDMVQPGQIVKFSYTYSVPITTPSGTYAESIQPVRENSSQWDVGAGGFFNIIVTDPPYRANYVSLGGYPSGTPGQTVGSWIRYKNTGTNPWYDNTSVPEGGTPLHLADTGPINRASIFYNPATWTNNNRPAEQFATVYESDGTTLAANQHVVQPGQIVRFNITYRIPFGHTYTTYTEPIQPVLEGAANWAIGASGFLNVTITRPPDHQIGYYSMSAYPTISRGSSQTVWIEYQNTGIDNLYDDTGVPAGDHPLHLADTGPINRASPFYDPTTWRNNNRPSKGFAAVYESDGTTLAANQHVVQPGQIVKFSYAYSVPSSAAPGTYVEPLQPVLEMAPGWDIGGGGFFRLTVTN